MHRTISVPRLLSCIVFAGLLLALAAPGVNAQEPVAGTIIIPKDSTKTVQMSKQQIISRVEIENQRVLTSTIPLDKPNTVILRALEPGTSRVVLIDANKMQEAFEVQVPEPGREELLYAIRKNIPTANVDVFIAPNRRVVLTGVVGSIEDAQAIIDLAAAAFGGPGNVINNMRVGGVQQVQLEVVVAVVNRSEERRMNFNFFNNRAHGFFTSLITPPVGYANAIANAVGGVTNSAAFGTNTASNLTFGVLTDPNGFMGYLQALRTENLTKILAEPRVVTLSGRPAQIVSGGETPLLTSSAFAGPTVVYKQFGTVVNFLPIVMGNGKIHLEVSPQISDLNAAAGINTGGNVVPGFSTRSAQVAVVLESGQTLAIGGLIQEKINGTALKVPVLGDLPFVGTAFRSMTYKTEEEELIILVTPQLIDPLACNQIPKFLPGRETRSPDDFELFLEGILEAPRGPRQICAGLKYVPAFLQDPTAGTFPCAGNGRGWNRGCNGRCGLRGGCNGQCGHTPAPAAPKTSVVVNHQQSWEASKSQETAPAAPMAPPAAVSPMAAPQPAPAAEFQGLPEVPPLGQVSDAPEALPVLSPQQPLPSGRAGDAQDIRGLPSLQTPSQGKQP